MDFLASAVRSDLTAKNALLHDLGGLIAVVMVYLTADCMTSTFV